MKIVFFNMRSLVPALIAGLALAATGTAANPAANQGCGAGALVLNIRYRVLNDVDTGVRGNNWAFDTYTRGVKVWRKGPRRFCSASTYAGTFATIAGPSPGGTTTIPAGIRGTFRGSSASTFSGTLTIAARGDLGTKDFACTSADRKGACAGTFDWLSTYFTSQDAFRSFRYIRYDFAYHATQGGRGTWRDALAGGRTRSHGDIVAKKPKQK